ncbi:hypothetical protein [Halostella sp. PRR32]|uniref:hypothetical protein n=1 Tax=Halostella sp. PRR32 TaxID=3098147 RepID=UPI00110F2E11|nr:hypothetical protein [Halostella sp. PRR32]
MSLQEQPVVIEATNKPQIIGTSIRITLDQDSLKKAGIDVNDPETVPDEMTMQYHKGGQRDGELVIDLKEAAPDDQ